MGMVPFLLIAAAEKRRRDEMAAASRRRKAAEEKRKKENEKRYSYSRSSSNINDKPYIECLLQEMIHENPELLEFLKKFDSATEEAIAERVSEPTKHLEECQTLLKKYEQQLNEVTKKLEEDGIEVVSPRYGINCSRYYDPYFKTDIRLTFNGVRIPKAMAENPDDRTYEREYDRLREENKELYASEVETRSTVEKLERRLKGYYFTKKRRIEDEEKYKKAKQEIRKILDARKNEAEAKKKRDVIAKLTPEQRELIVEFYSITEPIEKVLELIRKHSETIQETKRRNPKDRKEIIERAAEILGARENIGKEEVERIFDELDKVAIRRNRREYEHVRGTYDQEQLKYKLRSSVQGFIKHIYEADPKFVERNAWEISGDEPEGQDY